MTDQDQLAEAFEQQRPRLRSIAYRMLGSVTDADDALQNAWIRASAAWSEAVENPGAWLTTIVARVCLNTLRARAARREELHDFAMPDPIVTLDPARDPEQQAVLTDSVGIALLVVLEALTPPERLAFVLHDLFGLPFDEIAPMIERTPDAARQLASRARRRVSGRAPRPDTDLAAQRRVVDAFFAAARDGDFDALVAVLHPDVVFRASGLAPRPFVLTGAAVVAENARMFGPDSPTFRHVLVNGAAGVIVEEDDRLVSVTGFTVVDGLIFAIDVLADRDRLQYVARPPLMS